MEPQNTLVRSCRFYTTTQHYPSCRAEIQYAPHDSSRVLKDAIYKWFSDNGIDDAEVSVETVTLPDDSLAVDVWHAEIIPELWEFVTEPGLPEDVKTSVIQNDSPIEVLIFKQAIATGWDCPRASILVMLRDIKSVTFEIQTVGRILRMPSNVVVDDSIVLD